MRAPVQFRRIAMVSALGLCGALAAFAAMLPSPEAEANLLQRRVVEPLALQPGPSVLPAPTSFFREDSLQRGETPAAFLERLGVAPEDVRRLQRVPAVRLLRRGHVVTLEAGLDGKVQRLSFLSSRESRIEVTRTDEGFRAAELEAPLQTEILLRSGVIQSSLFAAADAAGVSDTVALQIADIFAGDVDFHRELRRGDRFAVVYEQHYVEGRAVHSGRVLAAEFVSRGRQLRAVYYKPEGANGGYYAPDGSNLRKLFLRSPLEYTRISSGFGMRRHPLLHRAWRSHTGVDFAAPTGTRVRAAGDGVVEFAGRHGGYGNMVILRHRGGVSTAYAHLSRFGPDVRPGLRVAQGDIIGYVGSTGWATGPHLHYEFRVSGRARNPYGVAMPAGKPIPAEQLAAFRSRATPLAAQLDLLDSQALARLK
ncbi:MAG TPA: peptidoglycan DD-metalloendopeptidase family protein [Burkholderiales bacterium]|nr:peptidoglycan DD-metalloendopeptidase family protein [Burkholderiales bacterium]